MKQHLISHTVTRKQVNSLINKYLIQTGVPKSSHLKATFLHSLTLSQSSYIFINQAQIDPPSLFIKNKTRVFIAAVASPELIVYFLARLPPRYALSSIHMLNSRAGGRLRYAHAWNYSAVARLSAIS